MARRFRVLVTDFLDNTDIEAPILGDVADFILAKGRTEADLEPYLDEADAMLVFHDIPLIGPDTMRKAHRCAGVVRAGVGYNNIDLASAAENGIVVCNVPDYGSEEVADHAILLLLAVARDLIPCHEAIRKGGWELELVHPTRRLRGRTLGIVGCGRIGTATALRAKAFGLDVIFYDPNQPPGYEKALGIRRANTLEELLVQSPYVSLHCYLDPGSYHLIDASAIAQMPRGAILINTARGGVVDQDALIDALDSGHLYGAGLDVLEREPLDNERIRKHPRVVLTPHSAFYSQEGYLEMRSKGAEEVLRILLDRPLRSPVNRHLLGDRPRRVARTD